MLPRARPVYPGPLSMTAEEHYEYVEARARITSGGNRIVCENQITLNVDFGTVYEERHSEGCVCGVCKDVERVKMGRRTVITGGCGIVFKDEEGEEGCSDQMDESGEGEDESDEDGGVGVGVDEQVVSEDEHDSEHDGKVIFAGTGKMAQVKIIKPHTPAKLRKVKGIGASTSTVHTYGTSNSSRSASSQYDVEVERDLSVMDSLGASGSNASGVAISYSHSPSHSLSPSSHSRESHHHERGSLDHERGSLDHERGSLHHERGSLHHERGRSMSKDLHATWDPLIKNKGGLVSKGLGAMKISLSKRSISIGKDRSKGTDGSIGNSRGKVWNFACSLSRRSNNSSHSSQMRKDSKEKRADLERQMGETGELEDHHSFEKQEAFHMSFQGNDVVEHGEEGTPGAFIGPRGNPEIHNFPTFDPGQFVSTTPTTLNRYRRMSGSDSNISTLDLDERSRSRSPSLRSRHYSSRGSFSVNWENISSDTVYHKHARRFYQNPASYGEEIPGYNAETDNPYLEYDRFQEVSEWADGTEEVDPNHVVALTTRELKRLCGAEVRINFDYIPEGYVTPPNSKANSINGDDEDDDTTIMGDEPDDEPQHKNLINLLGMPGWDNEWENMTKMQRHYHIVAAGDWTMGPVFDVKSNYSSYYGMPLFEPDDVGCTGVNRQDVRGLQVPTLNELQLKFEFTDSGIDGENGHGEKDQGENTEENVENECEAEGEAEYDSEGFLYVDGKRRKPKESSGPVPFTASEAERVFRRPSVGGEEPEEDKSGAGSEAGEYAGSVIEGYGITNDPIPGSGRFNESFRARMARGEYTATGRFDQNLFTPSNPGSLVSQEDYDTVEEEYDDGESKDYSFGNSSYHGTECQDDYVVGTSAFAPHAFQMFPQYDAAHDVTTIGITPDEVEAAHPPPWDTNFMEDIMGYSTYESHKRRDPTAEMILMGYLDPVAKDGSKSRNRLSTGSLTPIPSPTKSTKSTKSFIPHFKKTLPRVFNKDKSLPPTPMIGTPSINSMATKSTNTMRNIPSLRKASLSTANVAKLEGKAKGKAKYKESKGKGRKKARISPPSEESSESDSDTSYIDLTRKGSSFNVPPSQSLILYLYGHGLSVSHIALLLQPLTQEFLYNTSTSWWPINSQGDLIRLPPLHHFTPTTVQTVNQICSTPKEWWEGPNARDQFNKILPREWKRLNRLSYMTKAKTQVRKVIENFLFWRLRGEIPHGNLMKGDRITLDQTSS